MNTGPPQLLRVPAALTTASRGGAARGGDARARTCLRTTRGDNTLLREWRPNRSTPPELDRCRKLIAAIVARPSVIDTAPCAEARLFGDQQDAAAPRAFRPAECGRGYTIGGLDDHRRSPQRSLTAAASCTRCVAGPRPHHGTLVAMRIRSLRTAARTLRRCRSA